MTNLAEGQRQVKDFAVLGASLFMMLEEEGLCVQGENPLAAVRNLIAVARMQTVAPEGWMPLSIASENLSDGQDVEVLCRHESHGCMHQVVRTRFVGAAFECADAIFWRPAMPMEM